MSEPTTGIYLNSTVPEPPAGFQNNSFQSDGGSPQQSVTTYPKMATAELLGVVKPDGISIVINPVTGALSATPPAAVTTHDEPLTDGNGNFIFASTASLGGDIIVVIGVSN